MENKINYTISIIKQEINKWLKDYFENKGTYNKKIYEAISYSINNEGKRIRPLLCILTYNMYRKDYADIMPVACALEMIHTYSLIHDDLPCMDDDDLRRGEPTNHKVFGEAMAVLAGDGLLTEASHVLFEFCKDSYKSSLEACNYILMQSGTEGLVGGQTVDILNEDKKISLEELLYLHNKKTGALINASIISGAILGNASEHDIEILKKFSDNLGLVFQIKDDILDVEGDVSIIGKNINSDQNNNKSTFVKQFGIEECKKECNFLTDECFTLLKQIEKPIDNLKELTQFLLERQY